MLFLHKLLEHGGNSHNTDYQILSHKLIEKLCIKPHHRDQSCRIAYCHMNTEAKPEAVKHGKNNYFRFLTRNMYFIKNRNPLNKFIQSLGRKLDCFALSGCAAAVEINGNIIAVVLDRNEIFMRFDCILVVCSILQLRVNAFQNLFACLCTETFYSF